MLISESTRSHFQARSGIPTSFIRDSRYRSLIVKAGENGVQKPEVPCIPFRLMIVLTVLRVHLIHSEALSSQWFRSSIPWLVPPKTLTKLKAKPDEQDHDLGIYRKKSEKTQLMFQRHNGWYWVIHQLRSLPPKAEMRNTMVGQNVLPGTSRLYLSRTRRVP